MADDPSQVASPQSAGVPEYGGFKVSPDGQAGFPIQVPDTREFGQAAQFLGQQSQEVSQSASRMQDVAIRAQQQADQFKSFEAFDQASKLALHLQNDPKDGYQNIKGADVMKTGPNGEPLAVDYAQRYQQGIQEIAAGLANENQRAQFMAMNKRSELFFNEGLGRYQQEEYEKHVTSTYAGAVENAVTLAKANPGNADMIDQQMNVVDAAVRGNLQHQGMDSTSDQTFHVHAVQSGALSEIADNFIQTGKFQAAQDIYNRYGPGGKNILDPDAANKLKLAIDKEGDVGIRLNVSQATMSEYAGGGPSRDLPNNGPSAASIASSATTAGPGNVRSDIVSYVQSKGYSPQQARAVAAVVAGEGGTETNRNTAGGGHGAFGLFQIRDSGGQQDLFNQYGRNPTMQQQVDFYLAHNAAGSAAFKNSKTDKDAAAALITDAQRAGKDTPALTQRTLAALGYKTGPIAANTFSGAAPNEPPDILTYVNSGMAKYLAQKPDATPTQQLQMREMLEKDHGLLTQSYTQQGESIYSKAQQWVVNNPGHAIEEMPSDIRTQLPAKYVSELESLANKVDPKSTQEDDPKFATPLWTDPSTLAKLSDTQFMALRGHLTDSTWQRFAGMRAGMLHKDDISSESVDMKTFKTLVDGRLTELGLPVNTNAKGTDPEVAQHVTAIRQTIYDDLLAAQKATRKRMDPDTMEGAIDNAFMKTVQSNAGWFSSAQPINMFNVDFGHMGAGDVAVATQRLAARGIKAPTHAQIEQEFYRFNLRH